LKGSSEWPREIWLDAADGDRRNLLMSMRQLDSVIYRAGLN
jgi:hypothetical protein